MCETVVILHTFEERISSRGFRLKCVASSTGRRKTVTAAEMKEFEAQTECFGASKPQVLHTDHGEKIIMFM